MLDTGDPMIHVPEEVKFKVPAHKRKPTFGQWVFTCHDLLLYIPIVRLGIGNSQITIPRDFLYYVLENGKCRSLLRTMTPRHSPGVNRPQRSMLGLPFFSTVYTEFRFVPDAILGFPSMIARIDMASKLGHI